jgi:hypothetical protein
MAAVAADTDDDGLVPGSFTVSPPGVPGTASGAVGHGKDPLMVEVTISSAHL